MKIEVSKRDPIAAMKRAETAKRRVGANAQCSRCGERRPEALIVGSKPMECEECSRLQRGMTTTDMHHVAGRNNSAVTIPVPANDHRAELTPAQQDWPEQTLRNPDKSPLLNAAADVRGFIDTLAYLLDKLLGWVPRLLERLDTVLTTIFGPNWWMREQFQALMRGEDQ